MTLSTDDWCTPRSLADLLGPFDLDPCSNERSQIHALRRYTIDDDGLAHDWGTASVFCNPPYSRPLPWARKLAAHSGPWVALLKNDPTTRWYAALASVGTVAPFRERVAFERPDKPPLTAMFPSVLVWRDWTPCDALAELLWMPEARAA